MHTFLSELESIANEWPKVGTVHQLGTVQQAHFQATLLGFSLGNPSPQAPTLGIIGGIHGLERIGCEVALALQQQLLARAQWDEALQEQLSKIRLYFFPVVNPSGVIHHTRCNPNGVDLMRNAPVESAQASLLVGGHHHSRHLPWFRGNPPHTESTMEPELKSLFDFVQGNIQQSPCSILLDLHSGFGLHDQLWFPFAYTRSPFPDLTKIIALKTLLDSTLPHHVYQFEPQAKHYCTHGDLWDYLLIKKHEAPHRSEQTFLPITLEMGSWSWVKKNPLQLFSFLGPFNPIKPHRKRRILRRHIPLVDFMMSAVQSHPKWTQRLISAQEQSHYLNLWYPSSGTP